MKMTDDEIAARKFAMESKKENEARKAKDEASREAKKRGVDFDEKHFDGKRYGGRPDNAKIAGSEPADTVKAETGRIAVNGKQVADSIMAQSAAAAKDTMWMKTEYVPVTSFIHTMKFDNYRRIYQAYATPRISMPTHTTLAGTYSGDSIFDKTSHYRLVNTFAISMLEGFNKWAKAV